MVIKKGTSLNDLLNATNIATFMYGYAGNDTLNGGDGDDTLDGGTGNDKMYGGNGNDIYYVDSIGDLVVENANEGNDTVKSTISYSLTDNVENLTLSGTQSINGIGNNLDNTIIGNAGNNNLNGKEGSDTMKGGAGNDTYYVDDTNDVIVENLSQGNDIVYSYVSYVLSNNVEKITLLGDQAIDATGNALNNTIVGNSLNNNLIGEAGNDTLNGGIGADNMSGGIGNDIYYVDNVGDVIVENSNEGIDLVNSTVSYVLSDNVENLTLSGSSSINATGNALNNIILGNAGNNIIDAGLGVDTMRGGAGNDTYYVDTLGDLIVESANYGTDTAISSISYVLVTNVEHLTLSGSSNINGTGNALNNVIIGNAGNNILNGAAGNDIMKGGDGNDTYYVDNINDGIVENTNEGMDIVYSSVSHILSTDVENLTLTGTRIINGTGNALDNVITGNTKNNILNGAVGLDTMIGGVGNDTYYVENDGDVIVENLNEGIDKVFSSISYTLGSDVENLTLTEGNEINATGNALNNIIVGNARNNIIDGGAGADNMSGGAGNDTYYVDSVGDVIVEAANVGIDTVISSISYVVGANVENLTLTGNLNINGTGNVLDNFIVGNDGNNILVGGLGNDTLDGGIGADTLRGGVGNDYYYIDETNDIVIENANEGIDTVYSAITYNLGNNVENLILTGSSNVNATGNALNNVILANSGDNVLVGAAGNDILDGRVGADTMQGGTGNDYYYIDNINDVVIENLNEGIDSVFSFLSYSLTANVENLTLCGSDDFEAYGNNLNNMIVGNTGNNILDGQAGVDTMRGGIGDDTYYIDNTSDLAFEKVDEGTDKVFSSITYTLQSNMENLELVDSDDISGIGNTLDNIITGNIGNNILDGGVGADALAGGLGDDTYIVDNENDVITENADEGTDLVKASISYTISADVENLELTGIDNIDGTGNELDNYIVGNSVNNTLNGGDGNDTIDGGLGVDVLVGGMGDDTYIIDDVNDIVTENSDEGIDLVKSSVTYTISADVDNLELIGSDDINGTGNEIDNIITGNSVNNILDGKDGNDTLDGGLGFNTLIGGLGDDVYIINSQNDLVIENLGEGVDLVQSSISYTLGSDVENLELTGTDDINGTGNGLDNIITGNSGNNILDGVIGADTLTGGIGDDTYIVDDINEVLVENPDEGTDLVQSSISFTLAYDFENLELIGNSNIDGTGNDVNNIITGNSGNNLLDGGLGADTLTGGLGDDTYVVDDINDAVIENPDEGTDLVQSSISYSLGSDVENLQLTGSDDINGTGNTLGNDITGNLGSNILDGGLGADTLAGGLGDDTYIVDDVNDVVIDNSSEGIDFVQSSVSYSLGSDTENLELTGTDDINGTGNALDNIITGNSCDNILDGGLGADNLTGGLGDDTYIVDDISDVVVENFEEGIDSVTSSITYLLGSDLENLELTGNAIIDGTGNELDNIIIGNSGNNILDGGLGADYIAGGFGDDTYMVDDINDIISENPDEGTDSVKSSVTFTISNNIESLELIGSDDINGTGNDSDNSITGNAGSNIIDGGIGADTLTGGLGDDTYIVDDVNDLIIENSTEGADLIQSSVSYALGSDIENLELTGSDDIDGIGNSLDNSITGNVGNNILDGGLGADSLTGGLGDDTYIVDDVNDVIVENSEEGIDSVQSSITYTLGSDLENLELTGTSDINGTGNEFDNIIIGNDGNNIIDGGLGADSLIGGIGDDTYIVDDANDIINEYSEEGTDLIQSSVTYSLDNDIENIQLTGSDDIDATGNNFDNQITGNAGINILDGGIGADTLTGGLGDDTYIIDNENDVIIENTNEGVDLVQSSISYALGSDLDNLELTGTDDINGTGNILDNTITGNDGNNYFDGGIGADSLTGGLGNDTYIIDNVNDAIFENTDEGIELVQSSISFSLGTDVENLELTGSDNINATGNDLDNIITGNAADNVIDGGLGNDTLIGGVGNDTLIGGIGDNTFVFNALDGIDNISDSDGNDVVKFGSQVDKQNIAFFVDSDGKLYIDYGVAAGSDKIIINDWSNATSQIESIQLNENTSLSNDEINQLIQDMTSYASNNDITLNSVDDVKNSFELMNLFITTSWH